MLVHAVCVGAVKTPQYWAEQSHNFRRSPRQHLHLKRRQRKSTNNSRCRWRPYRGAHRCLKRFRLAINARKLCAPAIAVRWLYFASCLQLAQ